MAGKIVWNAALRGGDFIILSQLPEPQTGWAQQYSHDLKPAWARAFEPPAVCSAATLRNIQTLVDLYIYTGEERFLKPIPRAFAWLEASKIGPGTWARLYEVGTNTPIYGDRDSKVHYTLAEISEERQNGYRWQGDFGFGQVLGYYNEVTELGIDRYREAVDQREAKTKDWGEKRLKSLEGELRSALQTLDGKGRWVEEDRITCFAFVRRFSILCDYVEAYRAVQGDKAP